jgi:hypothetical protein
MDAQRALEDEEAITASASVEERNLERARKDYEKDPGVPDNINKYAQLLKARGTPESEEEAWQIAMKGFETTGQYRFRLFAGDIRIEQAQRTLAELRATADGQSNDSTAVDEARKTLLDLQHAEFSESARATCSAAASPPWAGTRRRSRSTRKPWNGWSPGTRTPISPSATT